MASGGCAGVFCILRSDLPERSKRSAIFPICCCARFEYFSPRKSRRYAPLLLLVEKYIKPSECLEQLRGFYHRDSRFFLLLQRITIKDAEVRFIRCEKSRISTSLARRPAFLLRQCKRHDTPEKSFLKKTWENSSKTLKCVFLRFKRCLSTNFTAMWPLLWISLCISSFFSV